MLWMGCAKVVPVDPEAKLELQSHAGGWHGGGSTLKVDRAGRYTYRYWKSDDRGRGWSQECEGGLEAAITQAWIDRVAALSLEPFGEAAYREMIGATDSRRGAFLVVYHPSTGAAQMPADASVHDSVRDEAQGWLSTYEENRPASESCRVHDDGFGR
jgi:hypothetical protein